MASYIEKFNSTIRKKQTEQILKLLNRQRATGQIRTVEEFTTKLDSLVRELTQLNITPTLKLHEAEKKDLTSSETFNFMLERVEDDLITGFGEAYNIDQVQRAHEAVVRDVILKNLKHGIAELESKVDLYEFLQNDSNGFTSSIFSTFRESRDERTARSTSRQAAALFTDPRTNSSTLAGSEDANIDLVGERLTLGFSTKDLFSPRNVTQLFDNETATSVEAVTRPGTLLRNMVDGRKGTYWVQSVLVKSGRTRLVTKLEFDLPGTKTFNFVELEPANVYAFKLTNIFYYDTSNVLRTLVSPDLNIVGTTSYIFPTITTSKVILEFECTTSKISNFQIDRENHLIWQALDSPDQTINGLASGFQGIQIPLSVAKAAGFPVIGTRSFSGKTFEIGFDNVRFGKGSYSSKSIYVSKPLETYDPLQVGLKTLEKRPSAESLFTSPEMTSTTYDVGDDDSFFHGSIEYWVIKRDFDTAGNIVATYKIPILPTGVSRVHHERLVLTERSSSGTFLRDVGTLMFFADPDVSSIKVYRNGSILLSTDWEDVTTEEDRTPNSGDRMKFKIRIKSLLAGDIFTVSYTPVVSSTISLPEVLEEYSTTGISIVDLAGNLAARSVNENLLVLNKGPTSNRVVKSYIYLCIMLRNNTSDSSLTPAVEEYTLVVGEKNLEKFSPTAF